MPVVRSTTDQTSYLGKIAAYREIIMHRVHRDHLGIPNLLVLTVTTSEPRMADIMDAWGSRLRATPPSYSGL
jgi:hypothetical protein